MQTGSPPPILTPVDTPSADTTEPLAEIRRTGASARSLEQVIADEGRRRRRRRWLWLAGGVAAVGLGVGVWWFMRPGPAQLREQYELEVLTTGDVAREVVATGRLEARGAVDVGAEISGRVIAVEVDHGDHVEAGQVLVRFDTDSLDAQVAQAKASVASAKAALAQAKVSLLEAERRELQSQTLHRQGYESHESYEAAKSTTELAEAQVDAAAASLQAQRASFELTKTQAAKALIESPISGVVIARYIDPGQTVAATFQTPVLFVIAEDLDAMEVSTPIDEADIGEVSVGQTATFTVDAYPDRRFEAEVIELNNEAEIVQNVVTYDAVLAVANPDHVLRPGMTASVRVETARADEVVRLPNAALRFWPPDQARDPAAGPGVWIVDGDELHRVEIETGVANGRYTQLVAGELEAGDEVITELSELGRAAHGVESSDDSRKQGSASPHT
jgi:HlyD family secretion protein